MHTNSMPELITLVFLRLGANSEWIQANSGEIQMKRYSQVQNTFASWENLIPLISPVATAKTGENSSEINWERIFWEKEYPNKFQLHSTAYMHLKWKLKKWD